MNAQSEQSSKPAHAQAKQQSFAVRFWGTRGSIPAPKSPASLHLRLKETLERFREFTLANPKANVSEKLIEEFLADLPAWQSRGYGGETSCVQIEGAEQPIIIDAGSGIRGLGEELMRGPCGKGQGVVHLFFTHFHWDHVIGLPFFTPVFLRGNQIHVYAVQENVETCVRQIFQKPFFPVAYEQLGAKFEYHHLQPRKPIELQGFGITPYQLDHPDPCWGYRIERQTKAGKKSYAHCVDSEMTRVSPIDLGEDENLYRNADLCYFDAQYTAPEILTHMNWGHSAAPIGIEMALREGVSEIYFGHHDPAASDSKVFEAENQTAEFLESYRRLAQNSGRALPGLRWSFARDGDRVVLGDL